MEIVHLFMIFPWQNANCPQGTQEKSIENTKSIMFYH